MRDVPAQAVTAAPEHAGPPRAVASYRTNLVTALLSVWFTIGLFLDAWAHNNVPRLETFFTPWHAVFYTGFAATAAWIGWTVRGTLRTPREPVPVGYTPAVYAVSAFAVFGVGDGIWHTIFGIEQNITILFSPTHLGLIASMLVIVTTPLRATWADPGLPAAPRFGRLLPALLGTAFATTLVLLFLQYANALTYGAGDFVVGLSNLDEDYSARIVSGIAVTTLVLVAPLLVLAWRWAPPPGSATLVFVAVGGLSAAITEFDNRSVIIALLVAGVAVDLLGAWLRPTPDRPWHLRAYAAAVPLLAWTAIIVASYATSPPLYAPNGEHAVPELYTGVPLVQALIGLLIAVLLTVRRAPVRP